MGPAWVARPAPACWAPDREPLSSPATTTSAPSTSATAMRGAVSASSAPGTSSTRHDLQGPDASLARLDMVDQPHGICL
ncbi:hypothetical protein C8034_v000991 [Colletotrichum sidae]|uniref:Uncharacterized protein n=1 Tax=Colletotrichum sidae TaxID=1347389 RepID=A0A4R8T2Z4_9PEZI|nr:hypothetical protein C8034_v000991 [Colletotrichum sidae]